MKERKQKTRIINKILNNVPLQLSVIERECGIPETTLSQVKAGRRTSMKLDQIQAVLTYLNKITKINIHS